MTADVLTDDGASLVFRFEPIEHVYSHPVTGKPYPHITQLLELGGLVDSRWYTEESRIRGQQVHRLTADYDLGAMNLESLRSPWRAYLLAYVEAVTILRPTFLAIEEPRVHPDYKFGGRPDRVAELYRAKSVMEIKSGLPEPSHAIQTALQAILEAGRFRLPPEAMQRYAVYLKPTGRFDVRQHLNRGDFATARGLIKRFAMGKGGL